MPVTPDEKDRSIRRLEFALGVSFAVLFFQVFPVAWWTLVSFAALVFGQLDVRGWTWRAYAVSCAIAIVALVGIRAWQNR